MVSAHRNSLGARFRLITSNLRLTKLYLCGIIERKQTTGLRFSWKIPQNLASKIAEIKEVKIPQSQRTIAPVKGKGRPKRVAIKAYQVGYTFGKSFEQQVTAQNTVRDQAVGQRNGLTVRPHVRRAHWHHYWTGAGHTILEVRWIQPTLVLPNEKKETELATIRKVSGDSASTTSV